MTRRPGVTLTESLVALFIAALGMISLLTLFPLGALQMGQALKDSRCAQAAQEADGLIRWYWTKYENDLTTSTPLTNAFDRGDNLPASQWVQATDRLPSYPVFVDPFGKVTTWPTSPAAMKDRVAGQQNLPRQTLSILPLNRSNDASIIRFCSLLDDLTYDPKARTGAPASGQPVERGGRYNWTWLLQRPDNSRRGLFNLTVIVFNQRSQFFANAQTEVGPFTVNNLSPGTTSVTLNYVGARPAIRKGSWLTDVTQSDGATPLRHAIFYRVASVNDDTPGTLYLELDSPIRRSDGGTTQYTGQLILLSGVAEVFDRPAIITGETPP